MDVLRTYCTVLSLPEAVRRMRSGSLPARAACVTFDDGYANNLEVALPILDAKGLTATIFIAVEAIRRGIMWNDLIIEAVRVASGTLDLSVLNRDALDLSAAPERSSIIDALLNELKYLSLERRWEVALEFYRRNARADAPRLMLQQSQLAEVAARGHDVGAHTISHPILKGLSAEHARAEIGDSRQWLSEVVGTAPRSFAYPNGRPGRDFDASHVAMVRDAGFDLAVTTSWGCGTQRSDVYQLPRIAPSELSSGWVAARLARNYLLHAD
jgi:peptidoglycan/xylan/chitin deacetylase (PgdA/CDA1 family)